MRELSDNTGGECVKSGSITWKAGRPARLLGPQDGLVGLHVLGKPGLPHQAASCCTVSDKQVAVGR